MMHRSVRTAGCVAVYTLLVAGYVTAQKPVQRPGQPVAPPADISRLRDSLPLATWLDSIPLKDIPDSVRQRRMVHVSPHLVVFTPGSRSATLEFRNDGPYPTEADVQVQFGYTHWQNEDTTLVPKLGQRSRGYDTVIHNPRPEDRSAVEWISGLPTTIALGPGEKRQVTVQINPPANLPDGEYYARIVTLVDARAKRSALSQDTKQAYKYPVKGWELPVIRDSVRVFYRKGPQKMGLEVVSAKIQLDPSNAPPADDEIDVGQHPLQVMTQLKLTGTTHFEGVFRLSYVSPNGDEIPLVASEGAAVSMHKDGIIRWVAQTDHLPLGHEFHVRLQFIATQDEFSDEHRLPMTPIDIELPLTVPLTGMRAPAVSTGQDLVMGTVDPYWSYIPGMGGGSSQRGSPAIVDTAYNYTNRDLWPWAMRTLAPANNINTGWLHPDRTAWGNSAVGPNTMRTIVYLSQSPGGLIAPMYGRVWSDDRMHGIYVNGKPLNRFDLKQTDKPAKDGYRFRIYQVDGLKAGYNVLDFVWEMKHKPRTGGSNVTRLFSPWYVIRVDFDMIFREMHNK